MRHDQYPSHGHHVLHQLGMLRRAAGPAVDTVVKEVAWTQQQPIAHHKERLTVVHRVVPGGAIQELLLPLLSKFHVLGVEFNAVVDAVRPYEQANHGGHVTSPTPHVQKGHSWQ